MSLIIELWWSCLISLVITATNCVHQQPLSVPAFRTMPPLSAFPSTQRTSTTESHRVTRISSTTRFPITKTLPPISTLPSTRRSASSRRVVNSRNSGNSRFDSSSYLHGYPYTQTLQWFPTSVPHHLERDGTQTVNPGDPTEFNRILNTLLLLVPLGIVALVPLVFVPKFLNGQLTGNRAFSDHVMVNVTQAVFEALEDKKYD